MGNLSLNKELDFVVSGSRSDAMPTGMIAPTETRKPVGAAWFFRVRLMLDRLSAAVRG